MTYIFKTITALGLGVFVWRVLLELRFHFSVPLLLLLVEECITIAIYLTARETTKVSFSAIDILITFTTTFFFFFVFLEPMPPVPGGTLIGPLLQIGGIAFELFAKITLGRSFGLLPANRGIVTHGPYRIVRHPIYFGYLLSHIGFLIASFSTYNLGMFTLLNLLQAFRLRREERLLQTDPMYQEYQRVVRHRFIPGIF